MNATEAPPRSWWVLMLALAATVVPAAAQDLTGALQGTVVSHEGRPEPEVRVRVSGPHLQGARETVTDRAGFFQFLALPPGHYALELVRVGLRRLEVRDVAVELGRTRGLGTLTVETQPIEMAPIVVTTASVKLDPVHTTAGGNLSAKDYDALPVDRDYKSLITILPQANNSYRGDPVNVGGSTGLENQYYIDGVNVTGSRNADRATSLPYDFVRAVDVKTGGYEAQYGRALGALINAVTYSGTNDFETSVFGFLQPVALSTTPRMLALLGERGAVSYDYGARLSGPVLRDRLWFSAAINPWVDRVEKEIPGHGFFLDEADGVRYATKLTWRAHPSASLELSVLGDPTVQDQVAPPASGVRVALEPDPLLVRRETGGSVASLRATVTPSPKLLLQASVSRQSDRFSVGGRMPQAASLMYVDYANGTIEGGVIPKSETNSRTSFGLRSTFQLTRHTAVLGMDYEDAGTRTGTDNHYIVRFDDTTWVETQEFAARSSFHNRSPAAYLQDTWRVTDRLAFNAGLRWSGQFMSGASGRTAQKITDEWQPRAGFVWQPGRAGTQRAFGSYGRYYQMLPTNMAVLWFVDFFAHYSYYNLDPRTPGATPYAVIDGSTPASLYETQIPGLHAENFDEFTLGYERLLSPGTKLTIRGMRRDLRSDFQFGIDLSRANIWVLGTPGKGDFNFLPPPKREYTALEVAADGSWRRLRYRTSYVLSRSWGNFPGLFSSDQEELGATGIGVAGLALSYSMPHQAVNSTGYLPNDRTHVVKLSGSYDAGFGLVSGAFLTFESGAPVNDFAPGPMGPSKPAFIRPRGSVGRTPALWNLDLRFTYALTAVGRARLQADILHVGSPRRATTVDELHYLTEDLSVVNPNYLAPTAYQPPMAGRIGLQVSF